MSSDVNTETPPTPPLDAGLAHALGTLRRVQLAPSLKASGITPRELNEAFRVFWRSRPSAQTFDQAMWAVTLTPIMLYLMATERWNGSNPT